MLIQNMILFLHWPEILQNISSETWSYFSTDLNFLLLFSHSVMSNSVTPWTAARHPSLSFTISHSSLKHVRWVSDATQPSHPLSPPSPPASVFPSIRGFSNELALCIRWPKYWSFRIQWLNIAVYFSLCDLQCKWERGGFEIQAHPDNGSFLRVFRSCPRSWIFCNWQS